MPRLSRSLPLVLLLALAGCDSGSTSSFAIGGTYVASYSTPGNTVASTLVVTDAESDGESTGTFTFSIDTMTTSTGGGTTRVTGGGTGTYTHPEVELRGALFANGTASADGDRLTLTLGTSQFATAVFVRDATR